MMIQRTTNIIESDQKLPNNMYNKLLKEKEMVERALASSNSPGPFTLNKENSGERSSPFVRKNRLGSVSSNDSNIDYKLSPSF